MWPKSSHAPACGGGPGWGQAASAVPEREPPPGSPDSAKALPSVPTSPASGRGKKDTRHISNLHNNPPPPTLTEVVTTLHTLGKTQLPKQPTCSLDPLDEPPRWALLKLVTRAIRIRPSSPPLTTPPPHPPPPTHPHPPSSTS